MVVAVKSIAVRGGIQFVVDDSSARTTVLLVCRRTEAFVDMESALRDAGHDVVVTDNMASAVELAARLLPSLTLIDPLFDAPPAGELSADEPCAGYLCRVLKDSDGTRDIPVLLVASDDCGHRAINDCIEAGADDYLDVRFHQKLLPKKVKNLIDQARAERDLMHCDLSNLALLKALPDMMVRIRRDGVIAAVVPSPECPTAYGPEEMLGRHATELVASDSAALVLSNLEEAFAGGEHRVRVFEYKVVVDEEERWREARLVPLGTDEVVAIVRDITERVRAVELAHQHALERRVLRLIENSNDVITILDHKGVVRYQSPAIERVLGYKAEDMVGYGIMDFISRYVHPDDMRSVVGAMRRGKRVEGVSDTVEFRFLHSSGKWHALEAAGNNLVGDPEVKGVVINSRDITDRKELVQRLMQADKLSAIGALSSGIAHEINNPLTPIVAYSGMLIHCEELGDDERQMLRTIHEEAERAGKIVSNLLQFSRQRPPSRNLIDINTIIQRTLDLRNYSLKVHNIDVSMELGNIPAIYVDEGQLQQVIANLIINAEQSLIEAAVPGKLTARTELAQAGGADRVAITIEDTGPGIAPEHLNKIFDPFFTTKPIGKGTGLGLALSYGIIKEHGGEIKVESMPGQGARFSILLPANGSGGRYA